MSTLHWAGPLTTDEQALLAARRQQVATIHAPPKARVHWPQEDTALLFALKHENPDMSQRQLAKKYLDELHLTGTNFQPTEEQVMMKIANESRKG
ncbi:hypothetical protein HDV00_003128 [Rhizophlyctis rosea]|nr:hypothetical protein HDV00_003128 [Rhizophlyctis rosea]